MAQPDVFGMPTRLFMKVTDFLLFMPGTWKSDTVTLISSYAWVVSWPYGWSHQPGEIWHFTSNFRDLAWFDPLILQIGMWIEWAQAVSWITVPSHPLLTICQKSLLWNIKRTAGTESGGEGLMVHFISIHCSLSMPKNWCKNTWCRLGFPWMPSSLLGSDLISYYDSGNQLQEIKTNTYVSVLVSIWSCKNLCWFFVSLHICQIKLILDWGGWEYW